MKAEQFNKENKIGSKFNYQSVIGVTRLIPVVTRSEAWELGHRETVVEVTGITGGVSIDHLSKR